MNENTSLVLSTAKKHNVRLRIGAYILAIERIAKTAKSELDENHDTCFTKYL